MSSFGSDPAPGIRKVCECAPPGDGFNPQLQEELGIMWSHCANEGGACQCESGVVRFGYADRWATRDQQPAGAPLQCRPENFGGDDPVLGMRKECWCALPRQQPVVPPARVAVVMLSRHPPDLALWLTYHLDYMGVERVFMQVEDTPEFNKTWEGLANEHRQRVTVWRPALAERGLGTRPSDDYETLQRRQLRAMSRAKEAAAVQGIDWLVHIDDDELLYAPMHRTIGDLLGSMPANFDQAYIPNVEAIYPSAEVKNCFLETVEINVNAYTFASYANGKSAVRVADAGAAPSGPHMWRNQDGSGIPSIHLDREPFGAPLLVVHYESCPFSRWEDKFWELGNTAESKIVGIPFRFYRDSIERMQSCSSGLAERSVEGGQGECSEGALRHLWEQWKTENNPALRRQDLQPLHIPWEGLAPSRFR